MFKKINVGVAVPLLLIVGPLAFAKGSSGASAHACECCGGHCTCVICVCDENDCGCSSGGECSCSPICCKSCCGA